MLTVVLIAWILLGISVVDTVAMLWLGATVLLNAERRTAGVWLVGSGLLMGGAFFACHALLLGRSAELLKPALEGWWVLGWVPGVPLWSRGGCLGSAAAGREGGWGPLHPGGDGDRAGYGGAPRGPPHERDHRRAADGPPAPEAG